MGPALEWDPGHDLRPAPGPAHGFVLKPNPKPRAAQDPRPRAALGSGPGTLPAACTPLHPRSAGVQGLCCLEAGRGGGGGWTRPVCPAPTPSSGAVSSRPGREGWRPAEKPCRRRGFARFRPLARAPSSAVLGRWACRTNVGIEVCGGPRSPWCVTSAVSRVFSVLFHWDAHASTQPLMASTSSRPAWTTQVRAPQSRGQDRSPRLEIGRAHV